MDGAALQNHQPQTPQARDKLLPHRLNTRAPPFYSGAFAKAQPGMAK
jgi:hypothetical protein